MSGWISFKKKIILFSILIGCVPILLFGGFFIHLFSNALEAEIPQRNLVAAKTLAGEINRFLMDYRSILEYTADRINRGEAESSGHLQDQLKDMLRHYDLFDSLKILDRQGTMVLMEPQQSERIGADFSDHPFIQQAMVSRTPTWSNVYSSAPTGTPAISLAVPFEKGIIIGVLKLGILKDTIQRIRAGNGSYPIVLDKTGIIIAHPEEDFVGPQLNIRDLAFILAGINGAEETYPLKFSGEEMIGSVARIPATGWLSTLVQLRKGIFATPSRMQYLLWTITVLIALVIMAASAWIYQKIISPLFRLSEIARTISEGHYDVAPLPKSYPEIDQLCDAFLRMAKAISEREASIRDSRKAIERSEKQFRQLYDAVSDLIYTHDLEGNILSTNKAMADLLGYDPQAIKGQSITIVMKPELRPLFRTQYLDRFKKLPLQKGILNLYDVHGKKLYLVYASNLVTEEDGNTYITGIGRNVTERILAERALRIQEARIHAILEAMPTPLAAYDTKGRLQFTNPAFIRIFGWSMDELQDNRIPFVPESEKDITRKKVEELYRIGKPGILETRRLTRNGDMIDVLISAALIRGEQGKPEGMVACFLDLTEKKKLEAGLLQAQKMEAIGTLAGGIAHDFNNLLMVIEGNVSLMMLDMDPDHPMMRRLQDIERNVRQGASLTKQLLGFAKGGKYEIHDLDCNELIQEHDAVFQRTRKEITIEECLATELPRIAADRSQIEQILMNLYINAAHAMPQGGTIRVSTQSQIVEAEQAALFQVNPGNFVCISVSDTGIGMDEITRKRIFEPFFTTKEKIRGTGLGLASVYGIVKNHGGFIQVESLRGKGSTFHIFFPAISAVQRAVKPKEIEAEKAANMEVTKTILLVDDEEMVRDIGSQLLEHLGHKVITAKNGLEAIECYQNGKNAIDLIILDMIMPGMAGGVVFDRLKEIDPRVCVILSSGYSVDGDAQTILDKGCMGFLQKPFNLKQLSQSLNKVFSTFGNEDESSGNISSTS